VCLRVTTWRGRLNDTGALSRYSSRAADIVSTGHARQFRLATALREAVQGARHCFGAPLPDGLIQGLVEARDGEAGWLGRWRSTPVQTRSTAGVALEPSLEWRVLVRYIWGTVMPSRAYLRWRCDLTRASRGRSCTSTAGPTWPGLGVSTVWQMVLSKENR
jgi:hypothetical protein